MLRLPSRAPSILALALLALTCTSMSASRAQDAAASADHNGASATVTAPTDEGSAIVNTPSRLIDEPKGLDPAPPAAVAAPASPAASVIARQGGDPCTDALRRATAE